MSIIKSKQYTASLPSEGHI